MNGCLDDSRVPGLDRVRGKGGRGIYPGCGDRIVGARPGRPLSPSSRQGPFLQLGWTTLYRTQSFRKDFRLGRDSTLSTKSPLPSRLLSDMLGVY